MSQYFHIITEENKLRLNKPSDSDVVYYSELKDWYTGNAFRSFSLKYVVDRCIYYKVGKKEHQVKGGNFLLATRQPDVGAYFHSRETVRSICIDICPATVAEAFTVMKNGDDVEFDNYLSRYFKSPEFFEAVCPVRAAGFGHKLDTLVRAIGENKADQVIDREWFLDLVEKIICHEYGLNLSMSGLQTTRKSTRVELLRRLEAGRLFMDDECATIGSIAQVAAACNMSEFHFFRTFRQAYGISPYQYLLRKRLELSLRMIREGGHSLTSIAFACNFPDLFTFSKAFKRHFGMAPSKI